MRLLIIDEKIRRTLRSFAKTNCFFFTLIYVLLFIYVGIQKKVSSNKNF